MNKIDVYNYLRLIPKGMVTTYKDICDFYNNKAYQAVGKILHNNNEQFKNPCYKVVNKKGELSLNYKFGGIEKQKELLLNDNVSFIDNKVDLSKCEFKLKFITERLYLRELNESDIISLIEMMNDKVMHYYEHHFSKEDIIEWFNKQKLRYKTGFGLLGCFLKENNKLIGQIGLTIQEIPNQEVIELGYIFNNLYWHQGYCYEASQALINYAIKKGYKEIYSIIKYNNYASQKVALRNKMNKISEFVKIYKGKEMLHYVYKVEL